jgi:hypothetical protein
MSRTQSALAHLRKNSSSTAGFSLLEVLAALVLTTLLIVALTPLVTQMLSTWSRGSDVAGTVEFRVSGLRVLRDDLRHAVVWTGYGRFENLLVFRGNETSMSFPAISDLQRDSGGLQMLSIEVASSADGQAIIRKRAPIIGSTYGPFGNPVILLSGSNRYFFSYYSRDSGPTSVWADPLSFPARVALNVIDRRGRLSSAPIQIPILASVSAACVASTNLPGCPNLLKPMDEDDPLKASQ